MDLVAYNLYQKDLKFISYAKGADVCYQRKELQNNPNTVTNNKFNIKLFKMYK